MTLALDHLVVVADTLAQGVRWCRQTFGIEPGPGGRHPTMGTHNRLFAVGSAAFPRAYFEVIAIDPDAPPPGRARWFGMDDPALRAAVRDEPRLVHAVARTASIDDAVARYAAQGLAAGEPITASRGTLRWRIAVRADGTLGCGGALPTLIEWGEQHPADTMSASGVVIEDLALRGLPAALAPMLPACVRLAADAGAPISARFATPLGPVQLASFRAAG